MAENFWSPTGKRIGSLSNKGGGTTAVYGPTGQPVGSFNQNGTFGLSGRRICDKPLPGLLLSSRSVRKPRR